MPFTPEQLDTFAALDRTKRDAEMRKIERRYTTFESRTRPAFADDQLLLSYFGAMAAHEDQKAAADAKFPPMVRLLIAPDAAIIEIPAHFAAQHNLNKARAEALGQKVNRDAPKIVNDRAIHALYVAAEAAT